jgi:DNA-binding NtrC family response regulator
MSKVLIVDDQAAVRGALELLFALHGIATVSAEGPDQALAILDRDDIGVVIQDMNFTEDKTSGQEGAALFAALRAVEPELPIILMTAWTSLTAAVELVRAGAADYIAKPWDDDKLVTTVRNLLQLRALSEETSRARARSARGRRAVAGRFDLRGMLYRSDAMQEVVTLACSVAASDAAVLITGPNGSGKEKLAEIIQANSRRREAPMVTVNAGGLPDDLLEAELFGAEAGAYTGANRQRIGRFEAAHGGTLFLDEIGNLSPSGQMKLLRVLQTGEFQRLGSNQTRTVDVRIISATNADLPRMIAAGTFREDLYFRLAVIELRVPGLAERADDVLLLAEHFLERFADGRTPAVLDDGARAALRNHDWPGNVRELMNRVQRATLVGQKGTITAKDLGLAAAAAALEPGAPPPPAEPAEPINEADRTEIEEALVRAGGVVARAAAELGLSRQALYRRMERLGVTMERRPRR